jgi:hypothetical protein
LLLSCSHALLQSCTHRWKRPTRVGDTQIDRVNLISALGSITCGLLRVNSSGVFN